MWVNWGTKQNKTGNPASSSVSQCATTRAYGRESCLAALPSVLLFTHWNQSVGAAGIPGTTLDLICLIVLWRSEGRCHTSHLLPVAFCDRVCFRIQNNVRKWRQIQHEANNRERYRSLVWQIHFSFCSVKPYCMWEEFTFCQQTSTLCTSYVTFQL